jgi:hypothetical protein
MIIPIKGSKAPFWPSYGFVALTGLFTFLAIAGQSGDLRLMLAGSIAGLVATLPLHKALMLLKSGKTVRVVATAAASWTVFAVVVTTQLGYYDADSFAAEGMRAWLQSVVAHGVVAAVSLALPLCLVWLVPAAIWFLVTNARSFEPIA